MPGRGASAPPGQTGAWSDDGFRNVYTLVKSWRPRPCEEASRYTCCAAGATNTGIRSARAASTASPTSLHMRSVMNPGRYSFVDAARATRPGTGCAFSMTHVLPDDFEITSVTTLGSTPKP